MEDNSTAYVAGCEIFGALIAKFPVERAVKMFVALGGNSMMVQRVIKEELEEAVARASSM